MDVLTLLKKDHDDLKALFSRFESTGKTTNDKKAELFEQIRLELTLHSKAEEEIFYPRVKAFNGEGRKLVTQAVKEHKDLEQLLTQISRLAPGDPKFDDRVMALIEDVDHHVDSEEREIFRFAKENCPEEDLQEMAVEIAERKQALERQLAA